MNKLILIGGGGHAISVIDSIKTSYEIVGIIDNRLKGKKILGIPVIGGDEDLRKLFDEGINNAFISIGGIMNFNLRRGLSKTLKEIGFSLPYIIDETSIIGRDVLMGEGVFVGKGAIINSCSTIGDFSIINSRAVIEHNCEIGEFVHVAPSSTICGGARIGNNTHVGAGSTIIQNINIGENVLIGAGSLVIRNILSGERVCGSPSRTMGN
ncbi:MAG: acetyltransferase [Clostridium sp.]